MHLWLSPVTSRARHTYLTLRGIDSQVHAPTLWRRRCFVLIALASRYGIVVLMEARRHGRYPSATFPLHAQQAESGSLGLRNEPTSVCDRCVSRYCWSSAISDPQLRFVAFRCQTQRDDLTEHLNRSVLLLSRSIKQQKLPRAESSQRPKNTDHYSTLLIMSLQTFSLVSAVPIKQSLVVARTDAIESIERRGVDGSMTSGCNCEGY